MREVLSQMLLPEHLLLYLFAYGLSATPTSYLVARYLHQVNLQKERAHTHTASYIFKTMSKWSGMVVFACDVIKGLLPCAIAFSLQAPTYVIALVGLFAVIGHCFSIWLRFLGGLGGATAAGALLVISWPAALAIFASNSCFLILRLSRGHSSILAVLVGAIVVFFCVANKIVALIVFCMVAVIAIRHWTSS